MAVLHHSAEVEVGEFNVGVFRVAFANCCPSTSGVVGGEHGFEEVATSKVSCALQADTVGEVHIVIDSVNEFGSEAGRSVTTNLNSADAGDAYDSTANIAASDSIFFMCVLR